MAYCKNELGKVYGDFRVIRYTDARETSNGCVKWLCECRFCGIRVLRNGNNLRFMKTTACPICSKQRRK